MASYTPGGKAHRCLALLETAPATLEQMRDHSGATGFERRSYWHVTQAMLDDDLVTSRGGFYDITERGLEALTSLRLGQVFGAEEARASVRVFVSREKAA